MVYAVVVLLLEEAFFSIPRISFMFCSCELDGEPAQHSNNKQTIFPWNDGTNKSNGTTIE